MKIETRIIHIETGDFTIGKITRGPGADDLFLLDTGRNEIIQFEPSGAKTVKRAKLNQLTALKQPDCLFFDEKAHRLIIADAVAKKLFSFTVTLEQNGNASFGAVEEFPLWSGSQVVAMAKHGEDILLLDKGNSMIRVVNRELHETKTIGSRMGYILEYEDEQNLRLGFEFPEDMVTSEDGSRILVSDSGNKRLVLLNPEGKQEKIVRLPEFPFKIIAWDEAGDRIIVSDFDCSVMTVSLKYGFVTIDEIDRAVDFFPSTYMYSGNRKKQIFVGNEQRGILGLTPLSVPLDEAAEGSGNWEVLVKMRVDQDRLEDARALVRAYPYLLPVYMKYNEGGDGEFDESLTAFARETFDRVMKENATLDDLVFDLAHRYMVKYKSIPDAEDQEAGHIDKENIRHKMFLILKAFRSRLYELVELGKTVRYSPPASALLEELRRERLQVVKQSIDACAAEVEERLDHYDELKLLHAMVCYWLSAEEAEVVFAAQWPGKPNLLGGKFLLEILQHFYFNIAELYRQRSRLEEYISFCDREITMFPDKVGIFNRFCKYLIKVGKYDDVIRMLKKFPNQDKENVNFLYYQVYLGRGDKDKAFQHLKKELELYSHRVELIPQLIALKRLTAEESKRYISKILEKSANAIDTYLNVAKAFYGIKDYERAEYYIDRELELFPENKNALKMKFNTFIHHMPGSMDDEYYRNIWRLFKMYIRMNRGDELAPGMASNMASGMMEFFSVLNHITLDESEIRELAAIKEEISFAPIKRELELYLTFITFMTVSEHHSGAGKDGAANPEDFLSAFSTGRLAYDYYFEEVRRLAAEGSADNEKMVRLVESILKYNPGDKRIFDFLDGLPVPGGEVAG